jgi:putative hemolysin
MSPLPAGPRAHHREVFGRLILPLSAALTVAVLAGCGGGSTAQQPDEPGIANPASEYCVEQGGRVDIRVDEDGAEQGFCVFTDGSECDEWAFFRGECEPRGTGG